MKKLLTLLLILIGFLVQAQTDQYTVRARYRLQADKDFVIGANGDTLRNTTQVSLNDTTIVTLEYLRDSLVTDSAFLEVLDSIINTVGGIVIHDSTMTGLGNDSIPLSVNDAFIASMSYVDSVFATYTYLDSILDQSGERYYEKELTEDETVVAVGLLLNSNTSVFINGSSIKSDKWSGGGTETITLDMEINLYDFLQVQTPLSMGEGFEYELTADSQNDFDVGYTLTSSALLLVNGCSVSNQHWSGEGTNIINIDMELNQYDLVQVRE